MLSTGEKTFLCRLFFLLSKVQDDSLIILEEPEIHLNYSWIKQIITVISLLFKNYKIHFLISTHSHAFINTLFPENIIVMEEWKGRHPEFNTFLANEKEINKRLFRNSSIKNSVEEEMITIIKNASNQELESIMNLLGESYFKYMVFKRLNEIGDINVENNKSDE
jgi:predicted ATPase